MEGFAMPDNAIAFGTFVLMRPSAMNAPPLAQRLSDWRTAMRNGRAQSCLLCQRIWRTDAEPPPAAFVFLRDQLSSLSPICASCASTFPDDNTLMDTAVLPAKDRIWPNAAVQRMMVSRDGAV
jgi:hypothetical protein